MRYLAAILAVVMMVSSVAVAAEVKGSRRTAGKTTQVTSVAAKVAPEATADWRLLLVNPWNKLPEDFSVERKSLANGLQVDARIYDDLSAMLGACFEAGLHPVVCSAYRTQATQQRLYNNKIARLLASGYSREAALKEAARWVAVPGTSEHQTGMALDIVSYSYQYLNQKQEETAEQKWLMEHCWEYGFILRYPSDKSEITGIGYEPWHYRYVGQETAAAIRESGLCLEEYLALPAEERAAVPMQPVVTKPAAAQPTVAAPAATKPAAPKPAVSQPVAPKPAAPQPAAPQPTVTEPVATEPVATEPAVEQEPEKKEYVPIWKRVELQKAQRKAEEAALAAAGQAQNQG